MEITPSLMQEEDTLIGRVAAWTHSLGIDSSSGLYRVIYLPVELCFEPYHPWKFTDYSVLTVIKPITSRHGLS